MDPEGQPSSSVDARRVTAVWGLLVVATVLGWWLSGKHGGMTDVRLAGLILIACFKIWLVMAVFMGLDHAPGKWRVAAMAWIVMTGGLVFLLARGGA